MKQNITLSLEKGIIHKARIIAAKRSIHGTINADRGLPKEECDQ